jgi:SnoaL-like domain
MREETLASVLSRAVAATVGSARPVHEEVFEWDVRVWSPVISVSGRERLIQELETRDLPFADQHVDIRSIDVVGDRGYAEWMATARQVAPIVLDGDTTIDAAGAPLTIRGITVADFRGSRIVAMRHYWDEAELLSGMGLLPPE